MESKRIESLVRSVLLIVALVAATQAPAVAEEANKIGIIDSQRIFAEYQEARDAESLFQQEMQQWTIELEGLERNIRAQQEKIKSQALLLSREKLDEMQTELDQMIGEYETKKSEIADPVQGKAVQRNQELSSPINQRITTVVEQLGAEGGFSMILDVATVNVVYAAEGIDLTDRVLEELAKSSSE